MSEAVETAKLYIASAEEQVRRDDRERAQSHALVGIGFALIGIAEALERTAHRTTALDMRDSATQRVLDEELDGL